MSRREGAEAVGCARCGARPGQACQRFLNNAPWARLSMAERIALWAGPAAEPHKVRVEARARLAGWERGIPDEPGPEAA